MRTFTLIVSIVAHACAACVLLFTTVLATDELPVPHDGSTFVDIVTVAPAPVLISAPRRRLESEAIPSTPLIAPDGIHTETSPPAPDGLLEPLPDGILRGVGDAGLELQNEPPPPPPPPPVEPIRVGGIVEPPRKIVHVPPTYPQIARTAHVSGVVILEATIDEQGRVRDARVLRSIPLLDQAALEAVKQWRFTPTVLNGQLIPVVMAVTVNFKLD